MIVRNESPVIQRCLASVIRLIDYWVIVDTGSTDGTQTIVRDFLKEIPGVLYERPWVNFGHNRNEALNLAKDKGDYLLFIDADERLVLQDSFALPEWRADFYYVCVQTDSKMIFYRKFLIKNDLNWVWEGVLHEEVRCKEAMKGEILCGAINVSSQQGHRIKNPNQYLDDAALLEKELQKDPDNCRNRFYLALSYGNAQCYEPALKNYEKRVAIGGLHHEEIYFSMYMIALMQEILEMPPELFINSYSNAFLYRPSRLEALFGLVNYIIRTKNYLLGYLISRYAITISSCTDLLFVHFPIYEYEILVQFAECALKMGKMDECYWALQKLLTKNGLPSDLRKQIQEILQK